jgi:toxin-antitoxin system PIN domain toxin
VILVDANLLIYAATACPQQAAARAWLDGELSGSTRVGLPWQSLTAFLRIVTNTRIYGGHAATIEAAWAQVEDWLRCTNVWIPAPGERHVQTLRGALESGGANLVPDAHLAAIAIEHGLVLCSSDRGFARFKHLRWKNPLE